jgi:CBS domain containing-hemolysin-like protein
VPEGVTTTRLLENFRKARAPAVTDHFEWDGWRFEVMDMDRKRVDKVLVVHVAPPLPDVAEPSQ